MEKPLISVIMSIYNETENELDLSISSILNQTLEDFEFIIVNDNPNFVRNRVVLEKYKKIDNRIIIVNNEENIGLANSLNKAISISKGKYLARMDADDISLPKRLEKQFNIIKNKNYHLVATLASFIDENGKTQRYTSPYFTEKEIKNKLPIKNLLVHPTVMFDKEFVISTGAYNNYPCAQDYDLWLRLLKNNGKFIIINEVLLLYRVRRNSISTKKKLMQICTAEYIKNNYKHNKLNFNETKYIEFLKNKKVFDENYLKNFQEFFDMDIKGKNLMNDGKIIKGVFFRIKAHILSNFYRKNLIKILTKRIGIL